VTSVPGAARSNADAVPEKLEDAAEKLPQYYLGQVVAFLVTASKMPATPKIQVIDLNARPGRTPRGLRITREFSDQLNRRRDFIGARGFSVKPYLLLPAPLSAKAA
jgi:hypothetical protein